MYPEIEPYETGYLNVGDGHELYYELSGNKDGAPVIYLHGGPGSGCVPAMRQFFNPQKYKIILLDQRGAGKSKPYACLENNSPKHLVADLEKLREHLDIDQWYVTGGSWGSALSMLYAIEHSEHVRGLALSGIFFADMDGVRWLTEEGYASEIMPDWFFPYRDFIPEEKRKDGLFRAYYDIIQNGTDEEILEAAKRAIAWDTSILHFELPVDRIRHVEDHPEEYLDLFKCWMHFSNNFYNADNKRRILEGVKKLGHIPCHIMHGRFDLITPVKGAFELHDAFPNSQLYVLPNTGHTMLEPLLSSKLVEVMDVMEELRPEF